ncbi:hypothetical protein [Pontibacter chitinilyticus]|uniref:hypothetical protein n=1 Tax=Pontibacter chitinilyticus TaxID=2674989 RepID=UPI0032194F0A
MKNAKLLTLLLVAIVFNLSSCKDDEEDPTPISINQSYLTAKTWKISDILFDGDTVTTDPEVATIRSTKIKFNNNGTYSQQTTSSTENGTWKFSQNETHLLYGPSASELQDYEIMELKDGSFKGKSTYTYQDSDPIEVQVDMVHAE